MDNIKTIVVTEELGVAVEKVSKKKDTAGNTISFGINIFPKGSVIKLYDTDRYDYKFYTLSPKAE